MRTSTTVLLVCLFALAGYSAEADVSEGRIAFSSNLDGDDEIFVMDADGSNVTQLTDNESLDWHPAWSPDGSHIAFFSDRDGDAEIFVMDADGGNQVQLTFNGSTDWSPNWSPDGSRIVFHSDCDGDYEIFVMDADGSNQTQLTFNSSIDSSPAWSSDTYRITFYSNRDGDREIFVMDADGGNQIQLTNNDCEDYAPTWSPDGSLITFFSLRDGDAEIFVMDADGSNQTQLTNNDCEDYESSWSPDGSRIIFASDRAWDSDIFVMDANGDNQMQLINNPAKLSKITTPVQNFFDVVEDTPAGSSVIISFDMDPSTLPELWMMLKTVVYHALDHGLKVIAMTLLINGSDIAERIMLDVAEELNQEYERTGAERRIVMNEDWVFLGFRPGMAAVILSLGEEIRNTFPVDYYGTPLDEIPMMATVHNYNDMAAMIVGTGTSMPDFWISYAGDPYGIPILLGVTAIMAPQYYAYLQSGQIAGLLEGLRGTAEYASLVNYDVSYELSPDWGSVK
ncbi:DUF5050 domain-containing protein [bacterium]|nr:DUF5050 domain-containing protein [bacterium]